MLRLLCRGFQNYKLRIRPNGGTPLQSFKSYLEKHPVLCINKEKWTRMLCITITCQVLLDFLCCKKKASTSFSVTEREVINGILSVKNTKNHCLAYIRYINNINLQNLKKASLFVDIINRSLDMESTKLLANLRDERLPNKIETTNIQKYF